MEPAPAPAPVSPLVERLWAVYLKAKAVGRVLPVERPDLELVDAWDNRADLT